MIRNVTGKRYFNALPVTRNGFTSAYIIAGIQVSLNFVHLPALRTSNSIIADISAIAILSATVLCNISMRTAIAIPIADESSLTAIFRHLRIFLNVYYIQQALYQVQQEENPAIKHL